jgi:hypothetical protein
MRLVFRAKLGIAAMLAVLVAATGVARADDPPPLPSIKIVSPVSGAEIGTPSIALVLRYHKGDLIIATVNGRLIDTTKPGRTETNTKTGEVVATFYGVTLEEGQDDIVVGIEGGASIVASDKVTVAVAGAPAKIVLRPTKDHWPADGRTGISIDGTLLDKAGNVSQRDAVVRLTASAGTFIGVSADRDVPEFAVRVIGGRFSATLRAPLEGQTIRIKAFGGGIDGQTQVFADTNVRPSIMTGAVDLRLGRRDTDFYRNLDQFMQPALSNANQGQFAATTFMQGNIGRGWLFTGATNTQHALNPDCNGIIGVGLYQSTQTCETLYPVFGDSSVDSRMATSSDNVYARLEHNNDFFMWGDYDTHEFSTTSQLFTATGRNIHGFKGNYNVGNLELTGLYGDQVQSFQRDIIAPDGTSGYYYLSHRIVTPGSENVSIESQALDRPGVLEAVLTLSRGVDYDVDYERGAILFHQPIARTGVDTNGDITVNHIAVTYEYDGGGGSGSVYGGRAQMHMSKALARESMIGATVFRQQGGSRDFQLWGFDALAPLGDHGKFVAEYAHARNINEVEGLQQGGAWRAEASGDVARDIQGQLYYRHSDSGFTNDATASFVPGQTRYGASLVGRAGPRTTLHFTLDRETDKGVAPLQLTNPIDLLNPGQQPLPGANVDASLSTLGVGVQQRIGRSDLTVDYFAHSRGDNAAPQLSVSSSEIRTTLRAPLTNRLEFDFLNDTNTSSQIDQIFPNRTALGFSWQAYPGVKVGLSQQYINGGQYGSEHITSLDTMLERRLTPTTDMQARYSILGGISGLTSQESIGLNERLTIGPGIHVHANYQYIYGGFFNLTNAGIQFAQPYAVGSSGAQSLGVQGGTSYSVGADYTDKPDFKASAKFEQSSTPSGRNDVFSAAVTGKLSPTTTALLGYDAATAGNQLLQGLNAVGSLRLGLAFRNPANDKFNALLRFESRENPGTTPLSLLNAASSAGHDNTFAVELIEAPNWRWEFYEKFAQRYSRTSLAADFANDSTTSLGQVRATFHAGPRVDIVGETRFSSQPSVGYNELGYSIETGYMFTPELRLASGYNLGNVNDRDFTGLRTRRGPFLDLTVKMDSLFSGFGLQALAPVQQPELSVSPQPTPTPAAVGAK